MLASQYYTLGKKTTEGWNKMENITERKSTIYKGEQKMVYKPVICHFHTFIMSENLLELNVIDKCSILYQMHKIKEVHFFRKPDTVYSLTY